MSEAKLSLTPAVANLRRAGQAFVGLAVIGGIAAAWHWRGTLDPLALAAIIRGHPAAPLVFLALHVIASPTFVPRTLLGLAAGIVFGVWWGLLWASLGGVLGAVAGFLLARYVHAGLFEHRSWARLTALLEFAERGGWRTVTAIRLVPVIPHSLANYALGFTRAKLSDYALGSLLGQLPTTMAAVDFGAAGERAMRGAGNWIWPTVIGFAALALSIIIPWWARRRKLRAV
ncbi:MAG TPA: VTT domain-containing protein [Stellaceae bacterium]|nr:VTT domain-containing protein [Stellaceae bacterium]